MYYTNTTNKIIICFKILIGPRDYRTLYGHLTEKKYFLISDNWPLPLSKNLLIASKQRTYKSLFKKNYPRKKTKLHDPAFSCVDISDWSIMKKNK